MAAEWAQSTPFGTKEGVQTRWSPPHIFIEPGRALRTPTSCIEQGRYGRAREEPRSLSFSFHSPGSLQMGPPGASLGLERKKSDLFQPFQGSCIRHVLGRLAGRPKSYPWKPSVPRACPNPPSLLAPRPGGACAGGGGRGLCQGAQALYQARCIANVLKGRFTKGLVEECIPSALQKSLEACIPPPFHKGQNSFHAHMGQSLAKGNGVFPAHGPRVVYTFTRIGRVSHGCRNWRFAFFVSCTGEFKPHWVHYWPDFQSHVQGVSNPVPGPQLPEGKLWPSLAGYPESPTLGNWNLPPHCHLWPPSTKKKRGDRLCLV